MENFGDSVFTFEFCEGFRRGSNLLYITEIKYLYRFKYTSKTSTYYVCYHKTCRASAVVDFQTPSLVRIPKLSPAHNHGNDEELIKRMQATSKIKSICANVSLKRSGIREAFDMVCSEDVEQHTAVQFGKIRRQLIRIRNESFPKSPNSAREILDMFKTENILNNFGVSRHNKEPFYRFTIIEEQFSYTVFISPTIASAIASLPNNYDRNYLLDGTLSIVPACGYKHLLIIHFVHDNQIFPFIYVFMSHKTEQAYLHIFKFIQANLFNFQPTTFATDHESALRNSLQVVFLSANVCTSWFHFCRTLRRKAAKIPQLASFLQTDKEANRLFRKFLVLPLLKSNEIFSAFDILLTEANSPQFTKNGESVFKEFVCYLKNQWIRKEAATPFCVFTNSLRTTTSLEDFTNRLCRKLTNHSSFFKFLDVLLDEDKIKSREFIMSIDGAFDSSEPPRKRVMDKHDKVEMALENLDKQVISIEDFLNEMTSEENNILTQDTQQLDATEEDESFCDEYCEQKLFIGEETTVVLCVNCCKNQRTILMQPCNHFKFCLNCFTQLSERYTQSGIPILCPICRKIVENYTFVFC